jgi:hypothetical protein
MNLLKEIIGISKPILTILLLVFFVLGAIVSYGWTMGFYASSEFQLPDKTSVTIENVQFTQENATFFNVTLLNPSYSRSKATIQEIQVETEDGLLHSIVSTFPQLPYELAKGEFKTFTSFWNWSDYTKQSARIIVFISEGSGAIVEAQIP